MTDELPDPMTPQECDLRGNEWMPFHGDRLFSSDAWLLAGAEGRCAMTALMWASWRQCPAASLPDQDRALAQLAGYGQALDAWVAIKPEAMRAFVLCSDGRFYHPDVAEDARNSWDRRCRDRDRKSSWRSKHGRSEQSPDGDVRVPERGQGVGQNRSVPVGQSRSVRSDKTRQDKTKEASKQDAREAPRHPAFSVPGVTEAGGPKERLEDHGRPLCGGWFIDGVGPKAADAAGMGRLGGSSWATLAAWLRDGIEPDTIYAAIHRCANRSNYRPPGSLGWFDKAVREQGAAP